MRNEEEEKELDLSCIENNLHEMAGDEIDQSLDLILDYEIEMAEYQ